MPKSDARPARSAGRRALPKSDATRERIISAAAEVLAERGYAGTKLSDIATRAGMKAGSLYYHFEDRDDLVDHVLRRGTPEMLVRVRAAVEALPVEATSRRRLEVAIATHLATAVEFGAVTSAGLQLLHQLPPELRKPYRREQRRYGEYWHRLIIAAQEDGSIRDDIDPVRARLLIIGSLNWVTEWPRGTTGDQEGLVRDAVELLVNGLGT